MSISRYFQTNWTASENSDVTGISPVQHRHLVVSLGIDFSAK